MITAAEEVISGPCGHPGILLVVTAEASVCVSVVVSSAARTGVWNIKEQEIPRVRRPRHNLFNCIIYSPVTDKVVYFLLKKNT